MSSRADKELAGWRYNGLNVSMDINVLPRYNCVFLHYYNYYILTIPTPLRIISPITCTKLTIDLQSSPQNDRLNEIHIQAP